MISYMDDLILITGNAYSKLRRENVAGREYIVVSATLIVPGVLSGSGGSLLYPAEEIARNPSAWNGVPIVKHHPMVNGVPVSARQPSVYKTTKLGEIFESKLSANGSLEAEAWFDVDMTRRVDSAILTALEAGKPIELSTGLFLEQEQTSGEFKGKRYQTIARNYRPDHLAVLTDGRGACSIKDGCGVNVNIDPAYIGADGMNKDQLVAWLTTNCECWKGKNETLNKLTEDDLKSLKTNADTLIANKQQLADANGALLAVSSSLGVNALPAVSEIPNLIKSKITTNVPTPTSQPTVTPTVTPIVAPTSIPVGVEQARQTLTQLLANATPQEQATWAMAQRIVTEKFNGLVETIVNVEGKTEEAKTGLRALYGSGKLSISDLETKVKFLPTPIGQPSNVVNYFPDPGQQRPQLRLSVNEDDLLLPQNFQEVQKTA